VGADKNHNWLDISFCAMEDYMLDDFDAYGESRAVIDRFSLISTHIVVVTELFHAAYSETMAQVRVADLFTQTAFGYNALANYSVALDLYFKSLAIAETVYEYEHPKMALICNNIGCVYILGLVHPSTANIYSNIAGIYDDLGDLTDAP